MTIHQKLEKYHVSGSLDHDKKLLFKLIGSGLLTAFGLHELGLGLELSFVAVVFIPVTGLILTYLKLEAENFMRLIGLLAIALITGFLVESYFLAAALFVLTEATTHKGAVIRYKDVKWLHSTEETAENSNQLHHLLEGHALFHGLPEELWEEMIDHCLIVEVAAGDALIKEGEFNHYLYLLGTGTVDVLKDEVIHASLAAGDIFGEISTLGLSMPVADVVATSDVLAFAFTISVINDIAQKSPEFAESLRACGINRMQHIT